MSHHHENINYSTHNNNYSGHSEAKRKEEIQNPKPEPETPCSTDITFFELIERRLDHVEAYHSSSYYASYRSMARRWDKQWDKLYCNEVTHRKK